MSRKEKKRIRRKITSLKDTNRNRSQIFKLEEKLRRCVASGTSRVRSIYIFSTAKNLYKIGVAKDPHKRLKGVQTGCPSKVELIFHIPTYRALNVEALIHAIFERNRMNGEWFKLNSIELIAVKEEIKKRVVSPHLRTEKEKK